MPQEKIFLVTLDSSSSLRTAQESYGNSKPLIFILTCTLTKTIYHC